MPKNLFYRLDSFPAFFQYFFQFLHGRGSQHGDSRLTEIGNALEDRGGGKVATGVENASAVASLKDESKAIMQETLKIKSESKKLREERERMSEELLQKKRELDQLKTRRK